jgi:hypothetical protein
VVRRSVAIVVVIVLAVLGLTSCSSRHSAGLPLATSKDFSDLDTIKQHALEISSQDGDEHPAGVAIVKKPLPVVVENGSSEENVTYLVRIDGRFLTCFACGGPPGASFPPTRWLSFGWDPISHRLLDGSYGSAPHLEEFGQVYAIDID